MGSFRCSADPVTDGQSQTSSLEGGVAGQDRKEPLDPGDCDAVAEPGLGRAILGAGPPSLKSHPV